MRHKTEFCPHSEVGMDEWEKEEKMDGTRLLIVCGASFFGGDAVLKLDYGDGCTIL